MSRPSLPKSALSAYYDGEASAEERAAVSRAAEKSSNVQQILDDYSQISRSLKGIHASAAAPELRDAVLTRIASDGDRAASPSTVSGTPRRRRLQSAGVAAALTAAGLMAMVWLGRPSAEKSTELAVATSAAPSGLSGSLDHSIENADRPARADAAPPLEPGLDHLDRAEAAADARASDLPPDSIALNEADDAAPLVTASIPAEWLTQQYAKERQLPKPGDVINYLQEVADESVRIPVTVVDVQQAAGRIRVLLSRHRIEPPNDSDNPAPGTVGDSNLVILVESDWQSVAALMDDLDAEGYQVASFLASSSEAQEAMIAQSAMQSDKTVDPSDTPEESIAAPAVMRSPAVAARSRSVPPSGMFFEASVSDTIMEMLGFKEPAVEKSEVGAVAEATPEPPPRLALEAAGESDRGAERKPWDTYASKKTPARVLIAIQKSAP